MNDIQIITKGEPEMVRTINSLIEAVNSLNRMTGDGLVFVDKTTGGIALKLDMDNINSLIDASGGGSNLATIWAIVTEIPKYNDTTKDRYVVQKASVVTGTWTGDGTDIIIERALGYEGYDTNAEDIRNWAPWYLVGSLVEIVSRWDEGEVATQWYIDMPMMYGGQETISSFRYSEEDGIIQAVWA